MADLRCKFVRKNMDDLHAKRLDHRGYNFFAWNTSLLTIEELLLAKSIRCLSNILLNLSRRILYLQ